VPKSDHIAEGMYDIHYDHFFGFLAGYMNNQSNKSVMKLRWLTAITASCCLPIDNTSEVQSPPYDLVSIESSHYISPAA